MQPIPDTQTAEMPEAAALAPLNPEQRRAVETTEGPLLVLAGAGTGKTRVLTARIAHILATRRAFPSQILAVTFTNKAAAEMRQRVASLLLAAGSTPEAGAGLWLGTFHSIGARILRRHAELVGLTPQFTILDSDDQHRLIKALLAEHNLDHTKFPGRAVLSVIQGWKDRALGPRQIPESPGNYTLGQVAAKLYGPYQERLKSSNCVDFGDLLLHVLTLFQAHGDVLASYAERFRYILVDEYQDTNVAQYLWLRLLAAYHKNLCCVGDDDQSIYGWRGAEIGNILRFDADYPGATIIKLERNYRSTAPILAAASRLIAHNESRHEKTLWTDTGSDQRVRVKSVWDDSEEARFIGEEIESFQRRGTALREMAVLVRAGYQTRAFEERFLTLAIPYRVIGGLRFYERQEVRDAIAYLRLVAQPFDDLAFERIINTPRRGIGKATLEQLHRTARARNGSLSAATEALLASGELKGKAATALRQLLQQLESWRREAPLPAMAAEPPATEAAPSLLPAQPFAPAAHEATEPLTLAALTDRVLEESGYRAMWQADSSPEAAGRLENLRELVRAMSEFPDLAAFLEHVGLISDGAGQDSGDMVNIMSLHAAKGLEFDVVFLAGWEEGLFPSQRTLEELGAAGLEEERRLGYVGITRARAHLTISHAANRRIYNQWQPMSPSRFLSEIPPEHLEFLDGGPYSQRRSGPELFQREVEQIFGQATQAQAPMGLRKGQSVFHQKFGNGVILNIEGDHIDIAFKHAGRKKILAEYIEAAP